MFRRTLLSLGASLAFSIMGAGAASAETPTPTPDPTPPPVAQNSQGNNGNAQNNGGLLGNVGSGNNILGGTETTTPTTVTTPPATTTVTTTPTPVPCTVDRNPFIPGCQNSGPIVGGSRHDRFDGRFIIIDGGPRLDVCGYGSYNDLVNRNLVFRDRFGQVFGADPIRRFDDLRRTCTVTTQSGNCTTVTTIFNDYRATVGRWNDLTRRFSSADLVRLHRAELDTVYRDRLRLADQFNRTRSTVNTVCQAPTTLNTIVVASPPVAYTTPAPVAAAPAPVYTAPSPGGQVSTIPQGSVNTGGEGPGWFRKLLDWVTYLVS